ncbi:type IV pilus biogenesis/stability protein PilW [Luteimonas sp. e5]
MTPERILTLGLALLLLATLPACNRLTFVKPNMKKTRVEQVRRPVIARDGPEVKARADAAEDIRLASAALAVDDLATTEKHARAALRKSSASVDAHTLLAVVASRRGRSDEAGGLFKKAAELSGGGAAETGNYGAWLCANGDAAGSLEYFDYAQAGLGGQARADALANAGACALRANQPERGERYLRQAIALDAQNPLALETLAGLMLRKGQAMEARAFVERRLAAARPSAEALSIASQVEARLGDNQAAQRYRQRLATEFPNHASPSSSP